MSETPTEPFAGRNALIFGGAKGIGRAIAHEWARRGARVAVADIDEDAARETAARITEAGGIAVALRADVLSTPRSRLRSRRPRRRWARSTSCSTTSAPCSTAILRTFRWPSGSG